MIIIPDDAYKLNTPFKAYDGDENYIFISYKHKDSKLVYPVIRKLHRKGFNIWYDAGLPKGKNYDIQIANHIKDSPLFISFITRTAVECASDEEDYMIKELNIARNFKKPVFPIYLENVELDGFYLVHMLGIQSVFKHEYGDNDDLFIEACAEAIIEDFNLKPSVGEQHDSRIVEKLAKGNYEYNAEEFNLEPSFESASEEIKNLAASRVLKSNDSTIKPGYAEDIFTQLPVANLSLNVSFAEEYYKNNDLSNFRKHMDLIIGSDFYDNIKDSALKEIFDMLHGSLEDKFREFEKNEYEKPSDIPKIEDFLEKIGLEIAILKQYFYDEVQFQLLSSNIAKSVKGDYVLIINSADSFAEFDLNKVVDVFEGLLEMTYIQHDKMEIESNIRQLKSIIESVEG